jgi:hypothetical protein
MRKAFALALILWLAGGPILAESARVKVPAANVRSGPSAMSAVVGSAPRGTVVEVVETSGEWLKVRSAGGSLQGWISSRLVERVPDAPAPAPAPAAQQPAPAPPVAAAVAPPGVAIDHKDVKCILAEEYPKLDACFAPVESVGRAQIHFRAADTSPWYAVDMKPEGPCFSAWLPKPKKETKGIEYFVFAIDRQFAQAARPDRAPGVAFTPRVVRKKSECDALKALAAFGGKAQRIVVSVARDAAGKLLDPAAAQVAQAAGGLAGFSPEGVVMASAPTGQAPPAQGAGSAGAAAGGGIPTLAIVGGVVAAGGLVAVVAGGGGSKSGNSTTPTPQQGVLTGVWSGLVASNAGLSLRIIVTGGNCTYRWDATLNLVQSGSSLTGPGSLNRRSITCNPSSPELERIIAPLVPQSDAFPFSATLTPPSGITIPLGEVTLVGTYTNSLIQATGSVATPDHTSEYTLIVSKPGI